MAIDKKRAEQLFNMVAENRKLQKWMGEKDQDEIFDHLDAYLYPPKAAEKGIEPDQATEGLRNMLSSIRPVLWMLKDAGDKDSPKQGLTDSEVQNIGNNLNEIFSAEPAPEETIANYLRDHGDKHLASEELQFISALVGAMRGIHDVMDHETANLRLEERGEELRELKENLAGQEQSRREAEASAIRAGFDISDEGLDAAKHEIEAAEETLKKEEENLRASVEAEKENARINIPAGSRYETLKQEIDNANREQRRLKETLKKLQPTMISANTYGNKELTELLEKYEPLAAQCEAADAEYRAVQKRTDANEKERTARAVALIKAEDQLAEQDPELKSKYHDVNRLPADLLEMESGLQRLQGQLSDPENCKTIAFGFDKYDEEDVLDRMQATPKEEVLKSGTEMQKYLLAKHTILQCLGEESVAGRTAKEQFEQLEQSSFDADGVDAFRKEVLDKLIPERQKQIQQRLETLKADENLGKYTAIQVERKELKSLSKQDKAECSEAWSKFRKPSSELRKLMEKHKRICEGICGKLGITRGKEIANYSNPKNFKVLQELMNNKVAKVTAEYDKAVERGKSASSVLEKNKKEFEGIKNQIQKHNDAENELGNRLRSVSKQRGALAEKKQAYNEVSTAKKMMQLTMPTLYSMEDTLCRSVSGTFRGHFTADRISAQLDRLSAGLAAPKRGSNSAEYTELKNTLEEAKRVFSGKEEKWAGKTAAQKRDRQKEILEQLGQKASHYLTEKEKQPHIWPFASASGFRRRAAAEDILGYCKSAADMVKNTSDLELEFCDRIAECKTADGAWKQNRAAEMTEAAMADFAWNVEQGIQAREVNKAKQEEAPEAPENPAPVKKKEGKSLGAM